MTPFYPDRTAGTTLCTYNRILVQYMEVVHDHCFPSLSITYAHISEQLSATNLALQLKQCRVLIHIKRIANT